MLKSNGYERTMVCSIFTGKKIFGGILYNEIKNAMNSTNFEIVRVP